MAKLTEIKFPDLGGAQDVTVIEILVNVGDDVVAEQPLLTLEGDKATMEVPSAYAGKIAAFNVKVGDVINEGDLIGKMELAAEKVVEEIAPIKTEAHHTADSVAKPAATKVYFPDLGGATDVTVIEVLVGAGDDVESEQPLLTLEGDKATMEVPAAYSGKLLELNVKVGDIINEGDLIGIIEAVVVAANKTTDSVSADVVDSDKQQATAVTDMSADSPVTDNGALVYAGPSVRRLAYEFGVDLAKVKATGPRGKLLKQDLQDYVKGVIAGAATGSGIPKMPTVDFTKFGSVKLQPLNKIKRLTGEFLSRNWLNIPHVTQHDYVDITDLEQLRKDHKKSFIEQGTRLTLLVFVMQALAESLKEFPAFNSSLSADGKDLILKDYINIGFAVDTPNGLVVPVIRDITSKSILELSHEIVKLSTTARETGLAPADMQGGCVTISSLGGIGGEFFTPIVNAPEVAILGLSKSSIQPVYDGKSFVPRLMLPLSLSYDHRVIDGAEGARFLVYFSERLIAQAKQSL